MLPNWKFKKERFASGTRSTIRLDAPEPHSSKRSRSHLPLRSQNADSKSNELVPPHQPPSQSKLLRVSYNLDNFEITSTVSDDGVFDESDFASDVVACAPVTDNAGQETQTKSKPSNAPARGAELVPRVALKAVPPRERYPNPMGKEWELPSEPNFPRSETVEKTMLPCNNEYFRLLRCSCDHCVNITPEERRTELFRGTCKCARVIPWEFTVKECLVPRTNSAKSNAHASVLYRHFHSPETVHDLFAVPGKTAAASNAALLRDTKPTITQKVSASKLVGDTPSVEYRRVEKPVPVVLPDMKLGSPDWTAEVVVLVTSLHTCLRDFFDSVRICQLLSCKGVEYFLFDANTDATSPDDASLLRKWRRLQWVVRDPRKSQKKANDLKVPVVLIDGVPIGGHSDLQLLEEENDLDYILARELCPNCLCRREAGLAPHPYLYEDGRLQNLTPEQPVVDENGNVLATHPGTLDFCFNCGVVFREMISPALLMPYQITQLSERNLTNNNSLAIPGLGKTKEYIGSKLPRVTDVEPALITLALRNHARTAPVHLDG